MEHLHKEGVNVCFIKNRSKHNSNTLLSLLRIFMKQTLFALNCIIYQNQSGNSNFMPESIYLVKSTQYKKLSQNALQLTY